MKGTLWAGKSSRLWCTTTCAAWPPANCGAKGPVRFSRHWQALYQILERLDVMIDRQHRIVELHYFVGLSFEEIAELLGIASKTVQRDWVAARTWLYHQLTS